MENAIFYLYALLDIGMVEKQRRVSERSLENLKLGSQARYQGKRRHNFTILPETVEWLKATGNASDTIDALVASVKDGSLRSKDTHNSKDENELKLSQSLSDQITQLKTELEQTQSQIENAKAIEKELREQLNEAELLAIEWHQKKKMLKDLVTKNNDKQKGYLTNSFGQGIKDLKNML
jgi:predicted RNase H-like nuclease (RuvC/YqgF family)